MARGLNVNYLLAFSRLVTLALMPIGKLMIGNFILKTVWPSAGPYLVYLVGPNLETLQSIGAKGAANSDIGGIAATGD